MSRVTYLTVSQDRLLADWARKLYQAFYFEHMPYHVGSSLVSADWKDVDVRVMMPDETYEAIAAIIRPRRLNLALSLWGEKVTGLPIDCQIQTITEGNGMENRTRRHAIGIDTEAADDQAISGVHAMSRWGTT